MFWEKMFYSGVHLGRMRRYDPNSGFVKRFFSGLRRRFGKGLEHGERDGNEFPEGMEVS